MTQVKVGLLNFEDYLAYDDGTDNRYELTHGELVKVPPETEENAYRAVLILVQQRLCVSEIIGDVEFGGGLGLKICENFYLRLKIV